MKNSEFVARVAPLIGAKNERDRTHGNLFFSDGKLYSYGYHYPLLFMHKNYIRKNTQKEQFLRRRLSEIIAAQNAIA